MPRRIADELQGLWQGVATDLRDSDAHRLSQAEIVLRAGRPLQRMELSRGRITTFNLLAPHGWTLAPARRNGSVAGDWVAIPTAPPEQHSEWQRTVYGVNGLGDESSAPPVYGSVPQARASVGFALRDLS
jgi:hypothetical protein